MGQDVQNQANEVRRNLGFNKSENRKRLIVRPIGTAHNEQEKSDLLLLTDDFIKKISKQLYLFENNQSNNIFYTNQTEFLGIQYTFLYELISKLIITIGLDKISNNLLLDLVIMRMANFQASLDSAFRRIFRYKAPETKLLPFSSTMAFFKNKSRSHYSSFCLQTVWFQF